MLSWTRGAPMEPDSLDTMSKSDILRGIIVEKLSTAAREILAVVERTVTDYEEEASGFRQEIDRQRRQLELLQPEIKQETSEEQQIFPVSETRGVEPLEEEEELHKYKPSEGDTESLGIVCYTEQQVEEEEHEDEEEVEVDEDEEEEEEDQASLSSAPEPEYEAAPRLAPPSAPSDRRSVGRPRISDSQTLIDLRIRILEDSDIDVLSTGVFRKYPAHELQCPRGLQEEDFLELLRSSFPQLADGEPFDVFTTDRTKRLLPLEVDSLTPEEIYGTIRSSGNSALYIRLKKPKEVSSAEFDPSQIDAAAEPSSSSDQTRKHSRRKPGRPRISDTQTHIHLRVRILEASQTDVLSASVFQKFPVQELQCPRGLQEEDFLELLRSSFPQLADGEPFDIFSTDRTRRLQPLNVETLTPEEISRTIRSMGNSALYIRLKSTGKLQPKEEEPPQSKDAEEDPSTPTTSRQISSPRTSTKCSAPSKTSDPKPKCHRKMLTIAEKVELLDMLKDGRSYAAIGRHYRINESTVRYIKKQERNIRTTATVTFNKTAKRVVTSRNKAVVRMESALALWISDCRKENISLDSIAIRSKAKKLYGTFAGSVDVENEEAGPSRASSTRPTSFNASKGWFDKFQRRFGLKNLFLRREAPSAEELQPKEEEPLQGKDAEEDPSKPTTSCQISR